MSTAFSFWIGIGAAVLVVLAHVALFWVFLRPRAKRREETDDSGCGQGR